MHSETEDSGQKEVDIPPGHADQLVCSALLKGIRRPRGPSLSGIPPAAGTASTRNKRSWRNKCRNASCGRSPRSPSKWPHVPGNFSRMQPNGSLSCSLISHLSVSYSSIYMVMESLARLDHPTLDSPESQLQSRQILVGFPMDLTTGS
jgi:hypothetical protein